MPENEALRAAEELVTATYGPQSCRLKTIRHHPDEDDAAQWTVIFYREPSRDEVVREDGVEAVWCPDDFTVIVTVNDWDGSAMIFDQL